MEEVENDRASLLHKNKPPRRGDYSTFLEPGGSIDSGLSFSNDQSEPSASVTANANNVEDVHVGEKVSIAWSNIAASVELPGPSCWTRLCPGSSETGEPTSKQVLFNVSGKVEAGTLLAVMGASGAGKTTLLNVLAHRNISQLHVTGTVEVNDHPIGIEINSVSAYIQQEDLFIGSLTVREHLTFQAYLRMEKYVPKDQRLARVEEVLVQVFKEIDGIALTSIAKYIILLGLMKCADSMIGIPGQVRGISGGEKKRLSFASEVLTDPPMLFVDEPTSGLDSFMAQSLVEALQGLAAQGRTIICTIHQPSSEVYAMFDSILLLAEGRTAYMGTTAEAIKYFNSLGYSCPVNFNPADYFVHSLAIVPGDEDNCRRRVAEICDVYSDHEADKDDNDDDNDDEQEGVERQDSFMDDVDFRSRSPYKASWCRQFRSLFWRSWTTNSRDIVIFRVRLYQSLFVGLLCGTIYFQEEINQDGIQNIAGVLYFVMVTCTFPSIAAVIFTFTVELQVFLREHHNGMYRTDVYFLAKSFAEAPLFLVNPLLLIAATYWMVGLREDLLKFVICYAVLALVTMVAVSYGYIISAACPSTTVASAISVPLVMPLFLAGGFYVKNSSLPDWLVWLRYLSWFNYGFEVLMVNQWKGFKHISCNYSQSLTKYQNCNSSCAATGEEAIELLNLNADNVTIDICGLVALAVGFRIIAYLFLLRKAYKRP